MKMSKGTPRQEHCLMPLAVVVLLLGSGMRRVKIALLRHRVTRLECWQQQPFFGSVFCRDMFFTDASAEIHLWVLVDVFNCKTSQNCVVKPQLNHLNSEINFFALIFACVLTLSTEVTSGVCLPV